MTVFGAMGQTSGLFPMEYADFDLEALDNLRLDLLSWLAAEQCCRHHHHHCCSSSMTRYPPAAAPLPVPRTGDRTYHRDYRDPEDRGDCGQRPHHRQHGRGHPQYRPRHRQAWPRRPPPPPGAHLRSRRQQPHEAAAAEWTPSEYPQEPPPPAAHFVYHHPDEREGGCGGVAYIQQQEWLSPIISRREEEGRLSSPASECRVTKELSCFLDPLSRALAEAAVPGLQEEEEEELPDRQRRRRRRRRSRDGLSKKEQRQKKKEEEEECKCCSGGDSDLDTLPEREGRKKQSVVATAESTPAASPSPAAVATPPASFLESLASSPSAAATAATVAAVEEKVENGDDDGGKEKRVDQEVARITGESGGVCDESGRERKEAGDSISSSAVSSSSEDDAAAAVDGLFRPLLLQQQPSSSSSSRRQSRSRSTASPNYAPEEIIQILQSLSLPDIRDLDQIIGEDPARFGYDEGFVDQDNNNLSSQQVEEEVRSGRKSDQTNTQSKQLESGLPLLEQLQDEDMEFAVFQASADIFAATDVFGNPTQFTLSNCQQEYLPMQQQQQQQQQPVLFQVATLQQQQPDVDSYVISGVSPGQASTDSGYSCSSLYSLDLSGASFAMSNAPLTPDAVNMQHESWPQQQQQETTPSPSGEFDSAERHDEDDLTEIMDKVLSNMVEPHDAAAAAAAASQQQQQQISQEITAVAAGGRLCHGCGDFITRGEVVQEQGRSKCGRCGEPLEDDECPSSAAAAATAEQQDTDDNGVAAATPPSSGPLDAMGRNAVDCKKPRTVGVVEPRVVVKIPLGKMVKAARSKKRKATEDEEEESLKLHLKRAGKHVRLDFPVEEEDIHRQFTKGCNEAEVGSERRQRRKRSLEGIDPIKVAEAATAAAGEANCNQRRRRKKRKSVLWDGEGEVEKKDSSRQQQQQPRVECNNGRTDPARKSWRDVEIIAVRTAAKKVAAKSPSAPPPPQPITLSSGTTTKNNVSNDGLTSTQNSLLKECVVRVQKLAPSQNVPRESRVPTLALSSSSEDDDDDNGSVAFLGCDDRDVPSFGGLAAAYHKGEEKKKKTQRQSKSSTTTAVVTKALTATISSPVNVAAAAAAVAPKRKRGRPTIYSKIQEEIQRKAKEAKLLKDAAIAASYITSSKSENNCDDDEIVNEEHFSLKGQSSPAAAAAATAEQEERKLRGIEAVYEDSRANESVTTTSLAVEQGEEDDDDRANKTIKIPPTFCKVSLHNVVFSKRSASKHGHEEEEESVCSSNSRGRKRSTSVDSVFSEEVRRESVSDEPSLSMSDNNHMFDNTFETLFTPIENFVYSGSGTAVTDELYRPEQQQQNSTAQMVMPLLDEMDSTEMTDLDNLMSQQTDDSQCVSSISLSAVLQPRQPEERLALASATNQGITTLTVSSQSRRDRKPPPQRADQSMQTLPPIAELDRQVRDLLEEESRVQREQRESRKSKARLESNRPIGRVRVTVKQGEYLEGAKKWNVCERINCAFWTKSKERMERHKLWHKGPTEKGYQCPDCSETFKALARVLKHDRLCHTGVKDYECRMCDAEVTDIAIHMRIHKESKQFTCEICSQRFRHRNSMVRHMFTHNGDRPYRCPVCDSASFSCKSKISMHLRTAHPGHPQTLAAAAGAPRNIRPREVFSPPTAPTPTPSPQPLQQQPQQPQYSFTITPASASTYTNYNGLDVSTLLLQNIAWDPAAAANGGHQVTPIYSAIQSPLAGGTASPSPILSFGMGPHQHHHHHRGPEAFFLAAASSPQHQQLKAAEELQLTQQQQQPQEQGILEQQQQAISVIDLTAAAAAEKQPTVIHSFSSDNVITDPVQIALQESELLYDDDLPSSCSSSPMSLKLEELNRADAEIHILAEERPPSPSEQEEVNDESNHRTETKPQLLLQSVVTSLSGLGQRTTQEPEVQVMEAEMSKERFKCDKCGKSHKYQAMLMVHQRWCYR